MSISIRVGLATGARLFPIGQAANLTGMHPQTLRQYDRLGLVSPSRTAGRGRRYTAADLETLREVQRLSAVEGINLAGIRRILALEAQVRQLQTQVAQLQQTAGTRQRVFTVAPDGGATALSRGQRPARAGSNRGALVLWRPLTGG
ncbi:MAG: helix-turn-helix transcriptional regulator [Micrococcales bacterium]|nr:helix-turn-helix transcriptional regulator [Micrococcales bacterium]